MDEVKQPDDSIALASRWLSAMKSAQRYWKPEFDEIKRLRKLAGGECEAEPGLDEQEGRKHKKKRVNLIHSTIAALLPHIYARLPEVAVDPKDSTSPQDYPVLQMFSRTLEIVVNEQLDYARMKRLAKTAVRRCLSSRVSWVKVLWQQDIRTDPQITQRIEDTQDNLLHLEGLVRDLEDPQELADAETRRAELRHLVASLEAQREVVVSTGLAVDLVLPEHILIETHIEEWEMWDQSAWVGHVIPMPVVKAKELFPDVSFRTASSRAGEIGVPVTDIHHERDDMPVVEVFEIWDKATMTIYTVCDGVEGFLREPYQPEIVPDRWYPFAPLALNVTDGRFFPLALTEMLEALQDEYLETRDKYAEHRNKAIPNMLFDADSVDNPTMNRLTNGEVMERIPVNANGKPLDSLFSFTRYPPVDGALYDTGAIRFDVEMVSGLQDAARGAIARAKTATEADIMQSALSSRVSEMQDTLEDWIEVIAEMCSEMALLALSRAEVMVIAGSDSVWPEMDRERIYRQVRVKIRAGTSGRPDKQAQQKSWSQIMPLAMEMMQKITEAELQGMAGLANAMRELLAEMLRRLDERFDIEQILPRQQPPAAAMPPIDTT